MLERHFPPSLSARSRAFLKTEKLSKGDEMSFLLMTSSSSRMRIAGSLQFLKLRTGDQRVSTISTKGEPWEWFSQVVLWSDPSFSSS